jgi:hypothetical protein
LAHNIEFRRLFFGEDDAFDFFNSDGKVNMKEVYRYALDENGLPVPSPVVRV